MNNKIEQYLLMQNKALNAKFEQIKTTYGDSDVKGGNNEKVIAEFIKENYNCNFISPNVEIIDSFGNRSDEIDIAVNNKYQPFSAEYGQPLIAEGVDFVVQAKKTITSQEMDRIVRNARRLKVLQRKHNKDDKFYMSIEDVEYLVTRIPYLVVAVDSQLTLEAIAQKLKDSYEENQLEEQPDVIFVLDRGFVINFREGKGTTWALDTGERFVGFCVVHSTDKTLFELMRYIHSLPKIEKMTHPLQNYFPNPVTYTICGETN